jgi:hypothetical protein
MKYYKAIEDSTTDVNGAWKPLKPISEGFEFVDEDQYGGFDGNDKSTRQEIREDIRDRRQDRRQDRKDIKRNEMSSGSSRRKARQIAKSQIPKGKPARRAAYLGLVRINFRGFAYKLDAIISGRNTSLINQLKTKWQKYGVWQDLVDAVNIGKTRKPFVCGGKCRAKVLDASNSVTGVEEGITISAFLATAWEVIKSLLPITEQAIIGKQQREAIDASEKEGEDDFNELSPEQKKAILDAEKALEDEAKRQSNEKYIYIGIGVIAVLAIGYLVFKNKK